MSGSQSTDEKLEEVLNQFRGKKFAVSDPMYQYGINAVRNMPASVLPARREQLILQLCTSFNLTRQMLMRDLLGLQKLGESKIHQTLSVDQSEIQLDKLLPTKGYLREYIEYTRKVESPMLYHLLCALAVGGAALNRNVWCDMGFFKIFPMISIMLVGPPGKTKKSTAIDIGLDFIKRLDLAPIMSDKVSPEALSTRLTMSGVQVIPAGELSVFFGKQRYNEGLSSLMLRLLDAPDEFKISTLSRGEEIVQNVGITVMGGTTPSLLLTASPTETSSNGFLSRFLIAYAGSTSRFFPFPERGSPELYQNLNSRLTRAKDYVGAMRFDSYAMEVYENWAYQMRLKSEEITDDAINEAQARFGPHILRIATILTVLDNDSQTITAEVMQTSIKILHAIQETMTDLLGSLRGYRDKSDVTVIVGILRKHGGFMDYANLLKLSGFSYSQFDAAIRTLEKSNRVYEQTNSFGVFYHLVPEGE